MTAPTPAGSPREEIPFKPGVVFDWAIHFTCNFRCHYCWFDHRWEEVSARNRRPPATEVLAKRWEEVRRRYGECHVQISGGEPTIYPRFTDIAASVAEFHHVSICSNFSRPAAYFLDFSERVAPNRCSFTASYHPQFSVLDDFVEKLALVRNAGYWLSVVFVAWPPELANLERAKERFAAAGLVNFRAQPFNGTYGGRTYPEGYTEEERALLRRINGEEDYFQRNQTTYLLNEVKTRGRLCTSGQKYVHLAPDGLLYRCNLDQRIPLGDFFAGTYALFEEPRSCDIEHCTCEWRWLVEEKNRLERVSG